MEETGTEKKRKATSSLRDARGAELKRRGIKGSIRIGLTAGFPWQLEGSSAKTEEWGSRVRIERWKESASLSRASSYPQFSGIRVHPPFSTEIQYFGYRVSMKRGESLPPASSPSFPRRFSAGPFRNCPQSAERSVKASRVPFEYSRVSVFSAFLSSRRCELRFVVDCLNTFGVRKVTRAVRMNGMRFAC